MDSRPTTIKQSRVLLECTFGSGIHNVSKGGGKKPGPLYFPGVGGGCSHLWQLCQPARYHGNCVCVCVCADCPMHIVEAAQSSQESGKGKSHLWVLSLDSFYA